MSQGNKKRRQAKLLKASAKSRSRRWAGAVLAGIALALVLGIASWAINFDPLSGAAKPHGDAPTASSEFATLKGRWQRPDGGYVLAINSIAGNGAMEAAYYNPQPIHIAKAEASRDGAAMRVFVELRDANYPGSTYTLTYETAGDQLKGIYYQAVEKQRFPVVFARLK